jgi:hypothetical protein
VSAKIHIIAILVKYFFLLLFGFSPEFACLFALFIEIASFNRDPGNMRRKAQEAFGTSAYLDATLLERNTHVLDPSIKPISVTQKVKSRVL